MRLFLDKCKTQDIKFLKLKYKIPDIVSTSRRTSSGQLELNWTGFADNLMLTFDDQGSLQKSIILLNEIFTEYKFQINIAKTKTMIFNQQYKENPILLRFYHSMGNGQKMSKLIGYLLVRLSLMEQQQVQQNLIFAVMQQQVRSIHYQKTL